MLRRRYTDAPKQVLVVVPLRSSDTQAVLDSLSSHLPEILPNGFYIDIWPVPASDPKLEAIRGTSRLCETVRATAPRQPLFR